MKVDEMSSIVEHVGRPRPRPWVAVQFQGSPEVPLGGPLGVEEDVGLSVAYLLHAAHVHLRVITVEPER